MHSHRHLFAAAGVRALARLTALLLLTSLPASAEIIGVEQFDYPENTALGTQTGGSFWDYKNTAPTGHTGTKSNWDYIGFGGPAYISGGKLLTDRHGWVKREYNGNTETTGAINDLNVARTLFARVTVTTGATLPSYFGFASYDFATERFFLGKRTTGNFGYEIIGGASASGSSSPPVNSTFTLVMRLDFPIGTISLFKNPRLDLPMTNAVNLTPDVLVANAFYNGTHWSTALRLASGDGGDPILWDDLVVATTWEDLRTVVTTADDEDDGPAALNTPSDVSLREAVKYSPAGAITFDPGFSGKMIRLTLGEIPITRQVTIDASSLARGVIIDANEKSRHFVINSGKSLTATGLTLGWGAAALGGSIENNGLLKLTRCTLMENIGGALLQTAVAAESQLDHCTVTGNTATDTGSTTGGLNISNGVCTLTHCTISGNQGTGGGGGLSIEGNTAFVTITRCIIAGNQDSHAPDIAKFSGNLIITGPNLIGNNKTVETAFPPSAVVGTPAAPLNPRLSPAGWFGGLPFTMHPLIGSPAIDAAGTANPGGTDARGFPRLVDGDPASSGAQLDIGAVEAGPLTLVTSSADSGASGTLRPLFNSLGTPGARIGFSPAVFPAQSITLEHGQFTVTAGKFIFLDASNLPSPVTLSGAGASRLFRVEPTASLAMQNLRLMDGKPAGDEENRDSGAGILNSGTLTLLHTEVRNCQTFVHEGAAFNNEAGGAGGGAIHSHEGTTHLYQCLLAQNTADGADLGGLGYTGGSGGAIRNSAGTLTVIASTFSGNRTDHGGFPGHGGAIYNRSMLKIVRSSLLQNTGGTTTLLFFLNAYGGSGGGIFNDLYGNASVSACTLSGNQCGAGTFGGLGGGILNAGVLTVHRSTLTGNSAGPGLRSGTGGGISNIVDAGTGAGGILEVTHCTITNNICYEGEDHKFGGGIHNDSTVPYTLKHSIVSGNYGFSQQDVQIGPHDLSGPVTQTGNYIGGTPLLAPLGDYGGPTFTRMPLPGSPVINAGPAAVSIASVDQRGLLQIGNRDIGAVEVLSGPRADVDADGMDDRLEPLYGLVVGINDGSLDADSDGSKNKDELGNMTNPRDATSLLDIITFSRTGDNVSVSWKSFPGLSYSLEYGNTLNLGGSVNVGTATGMTSSTVVGPFTGPRTFFRIRRN